MTTQNKQPQSALVSAANCVFICSRRQVSAVQKHHTTAMFLKKYIIDVSPYKSQSHVPELETPLSERVRAFLDWLQDNRAFSSMIHVVK